MKKKLCIILFLLIVIIVGATILPQGEDYDYLRLHIRANSNMAIDQNVKYKVKECVVEFLTPLFAEVESKNQAIEIVNNNKQILKSICDKTLKENGFNYTSNIKVDNEYFPTRSYQNVTLESGYYDAVIIELGEAVGDNWWCVMYPPLCFVNNFENNTQIKYKSKILEWLKSLFN